MKHLIINLLFLLTAIAFVTSCSQNVRFKKFEVQKKEVTAGSAECAIDVQFLFPVKYANKTALTQLQQNLLALIFGENFKELDGQAAVSEFVNQTISEFKLNAQGLEEFAYSEEWYLNSDIIYNNKDLLSYAVERYTYTGGAHGLETVEYFLFDMKTGNRIDQFEIFSEVSKNEISELLKSKIKQDNGFANEDKMVAHGYLFPEKIVPNNNFCVTDSSLIFMFNPYEIAAYSVGTTQVELKFEEIKTFLIKNNPLSKLVK